MRSALRVRASANPLFDNERAVLHNSPFTTVGFAVLAVWLMEAQISRKQADILLRVVNSVVRVVHPTWDLWRNASVMRSHIEQAMDCDEILALPNPFNDSAQFAAMRHLKDMASRWCLSPHIM